MPGLKRQREPARAELRGLNRLLAQIDRRSEHTGSPDASSAASIATSGWPPAHGVSGPAHR